MARYKPDALTHELIQSLSTSDFNFILEYVKDFNAIRAAVVCGMEPEFGYEVKKRPALIAAIEVILARRIESQDIDPDWVLMEAMENVYISRQKGQMAASNSALNIVAKHCNVDAYAADKIKIDTADDVVQRLKRARDRIEPPSFL